MANQIRTKANRSTFGSVRQLRSKRWQARYPDENGAPMSAPQTFLTAKEAWDHIAKVRTDRKAQVYTDHRKGERPLADFAREWIANGGSRGHLADSTKVLYLDLLESTIAPRLGSEAIGKVTPAAVRTWHTALGKDLAARGAKPTKDGEQRRGNGKTRQRQAYAFLKAVLNTAVGDGLLGKNPCNLKGAGTASAPKRRFMSVGEFARILGALPERLRAPMIVAVTAHMRPSELVALQRRDLDLKAGTLRIERQVKKLPGKAPELTPTKNGEERTIELPSIALDALRKYLATVPKAMPTMPLFLNTKGDALTVSGVRQIWNKARAKVGLTEHSLYSTKHTGLTLAAINGATMEELRTIAGHRTNAAASAYQLYAKERGRAIADGLDNALSGLKAIGL